MASLSAGSPHTPEDLRQQAAQSRERARELTRQAQTLKEQVEAALVLARQQLAAADEAIARSRTVLQKTGILLDNLAQCGNAMPNSYPHCMEFVLPPHIVVDMPPRLTPASPSLAAAGHNDRAS